MVSIFTRDGDYYKDAQLVENGTLLFHILAVTIAMSLGHSLDIYELIQMASLQRSLCDVTHWKELHLVSWAHSHSAGRKALIIFLPIWPQKAYACILGAYRILFA